MALLFTLDESFVSQYREKREPFGYGELGKATFIRTYARTDNPRVEGRETWTDVVRRVTEGTFSMLLEYVRDHAVDGWNIEQVSDLSREFFDRLWHLEWSPPGRGLWMMGTPFVHERGVTEALQNCGFISSADIATEGGDIFAWFMEMLMVGVGVGADLKGADHNFSIKASNGLRFTYEIPDSRQGWGESIRLQMDSYLRGGHDVDFSYALIRPRGTPIRGFGGYAEGPEILKNLHDTVRSIFDPLRPQGNMSRLMGTSRLADVFNLIGRCVVAGNVRRSAEILLGAPGDTTFLDLKTDWAARPWAGYSNNSVLFEYPEQVRDHVLDDMAERAWHNGEPGAGFLYNTHNFARMNGVFDTRDKAVGANPCYEIGLYNRELCTLAEVHMPRTRTKRDYLRATKMAQLYAMIVTLGNERISDAKTREVMMANRRTGTGQTGIAQFEADHGAAVYEDWSDHAYLMTGQHVRDWSQWLGIPESIRRTSIKPSGTVSLLSGVTAGIHDPWSAFYVRRVRMSANSILPARLEASGYHVEPAIGDSGTVVVSFPIATDPRLMMRGESEVPIMEKVERAARAARHYTDNAVSLTASFLPEQVSPKELAEVFRFASKNLKSISVLASSSHGYEQAPYEALTPGQYGGMVHNLRPVDYAGVGHEMEDIFCDGEACELPAFGS